VGFFEPEFLHEHARVVLAREGRPHIHLRVDEADILQLHDQIGDLLRPVLPAGLDHPDRKAVERNIEDMPALAGEPGGQPAKLVVMLEEEHAVAGLREHICARKAPQAAPDDDHIILVGDTFKPVVSHGTVRIAPLPAEAQLRV
jgi:hypothetical protein